MALAVGELVAYLDVDSSKFNTGLGHAESKFSSFGSKIGGIASSIGSLALAGAATGLVALAGGLGAGALAGMKFNSSIEQTTIAMGTMLGSTDAARTLIGEVVKMAAATPFEFPELADATKRLVAYGVSAGDAVPLMTRLGDVSSALGITIGEMADLYGKMKVSGRITMEDVNQLAGRGVPIYAELAKVLGVTQSEIRGMVEAGKIGFPDIEKAFQNMTNQGGMFAGMMDAQSKSFAGLLSTLKDNATQVFATALTPLFNWLVDTALPKAISLVDAFSKGFATGGFAGGLEAILPKETADQIISTFNTIKDVVLGVVGAVKEVVGVFISLPAPVQEAVIVMGGLALVLGKLGLLSSIPGVISAVGTAVTSLGLAGAGATGALGLLTASIYTLGVAAVAVGLALLIKDLVEGKRAADSFNESVDKAVDAVDGFSDKEKAFAKGPGQQFADTFVHMRDPVVKLGLTTEETADLITIITTKLVGKNKEQWEQIATDTTEAFMRGERNVNEGTDRMVAKVGESLQQIVTDTKRQLEPIPPWVEMTLKGFSLAIGSAYGLGEQEAQRWASAIRNTTEEKLGGVPGIASSSLSGLASAIGSQFQMAYNEAVRWAQAIRQATANISPYKAMSPAPALVVIDGYQKMASGMEAQWSRMLTTAKAYAEQIRAATSRLVTGTGVDGYFTGGTGPGNTSGGSEIAAAVAAAGPVATSTGLSPEAEAHYQAMEGRQLAYLAGTDTTGWTEAQYAAVYQAGQAAAIAQNDATAADLANLRNQEMAANKAAGITPQRRNNDVPVADISPLLDELRGLREEFKRQNNRALQLARSGAMA
jgi:tape measure domain-containing protein